MDEEEEEEEATGEVESKGDDDSGDTSSGLDRVDIARRVERGSRGKRRDPCEVLDPRRSESAAADVGVQGGLEGNSFCALDAWATSSFNFI